MSHVITCPSGLTGRVRGMKVREERILADRKLAKSGGQVDELLGACWEETLDPGTRGARPAVMTPISKDTECGRVLPVFVDIAKGPDDIARVLSSEGPLRARAPPRRAAPAPRPGQLCLLFG